MRTNATGRRTGVLFLALALAGGTPHAAPPGDGGAIEEPRYIPAGVIDAAGTVVCVRTPDEGVEVIDAAKGRSLWRVPAPARALMLARDRAFVLEQRAGMRLRLAVYAARTGRLLKEYDLQRLDLPQWASVAEGTMGRESRRLMVAARLTAETLELRYDATLTRISGFQGAVVADRAEGGVRVDLESGRVDRRPGPAAPEPPLFEAAPPLPGARFIQVHARALDAMLVFGGPPPGDSGALVVGDRRVAFEFGPDTTTLIVHRWTSPAGGRDEPLRLEHGQATDAVWVTLDRRHALLRRAYDQSRYDLFSLETGGALGRLDRPADVAVYAGRVFWTTLEAKGRLVLHAGDAATGRSRWQRIVRPPEGPPGPPIP